MEAYPLGMRTMLRASKSRSQPASFRIAQPRRGKGYAQAIGTDTPLFWDASFLFTASEALVFRLWFTQVIRGGLDEFTMPIDTEFGTITYVCQFLDENLMPAKQMGGLWSYSAQIMTRGEVFPPGYAEAAALIVGLPDWQAWASLLDQTVTDAMPEA